MLDRPPLASLDARDCRLSLSSRDANALGAGSPISHRGFTIGQVEEARIPAEKSEMQYQLFINAPYDVLVSSNSRFWLTPGFEVSMSSEGMKVKMDSLESPDQRRHHHGLPPGWLPGASETERRNVLAGHGSVHRLCLPVQDVGGLHPGAAIQYRGIRSVPSFRLPFIDDKAGVQLFRCWRASGAASLPPLCQCGEGSSGGPCSTSSSRKG